MALHDTHYHLDLAKDPERSLNDIESAGVYTIAVTNAPSVFPFTLKLSQKTKYCRAALGLHPELALQRKQELNLFRNYASQTKYIGEIGLNGRNIDFVTTQAQTEVFETILNCCANFGNKILTVHSRRASSKVIEMIGNNYPGKIILHWFSGTIKELQLAVDYGFFFSVNHSMLKGRSGQKILKAIPTNRLLTESDGPFTEFNGIPATPLVVENTIRTIANLLNVDVEGIANQLHRNLESVLSEYQP